VVSVFENKAKKERFLASASEREMPATHQKSDPRQSEYVIDKEGHCGFGF
jgi:hypothetical protein